MARLLGLSGEEICSLAHLKIAGPTFVADVAPHLAAARSQAGEALIKTSAGELYRVIVEAWELRDEGGRQIGRVRGTVTDKPPST